MAGELDKCRFDAGKIEFGWSFLLLCLGLCGLLSTGVEVILHRAEHWLKHDAVYSAFYGKVLKELVILGFLSFTLMLVRDFGSLTKNQFLILEFGHLWIFSVSLIFVFQGMHIAQSLRSSKDRWDKAFSNGLQRVEQDYVVLQESQNITRMVHPGWAWTWTSSALCFDGRTKRSRLVRQARLWVMRKAYIDRNRLPRSFEFAKFLRRSLSRHVVDQVDIGASTWAVLCAIFLGSAGVLELAELDQSKIEPEKVSIAVLSITIGLVFVAISMLGLIELGTRRYLRHAGCKRPTSMAYLLDFVRLAYKQEYEQNAKNDATDLLESPEDLRKDVHKEEKSKKKSVANITEKIPGFAKAKHVLGKSMRSINDESDSAYDENVRKARQARRVDEARLDAILEQVQDRKQGVGQFKRHRQNVVLGLEEYQDDRFWPITKARWYMFTFRIILLTQCYMFGLTLVLFLSSRNLESSVVSIICFVGEILSHWFLISVLIPRIVRDFAILNSLTSVDAGDIEMIDGTLLYQKETNLALFNLAEALHKGYQELGADGYGEVYQALGGKVVIDSNLERGLHYGDLKRGLKKKPFSTVVQTAALRRIYRALNCSNGFRLDTCRFLIEGMDRLANSIEINEKRIASCFAKAAKVQCDCCGNKFPVLEAAEHVKHCLGARATRPETEIELQATRLLARSTYGLLRPFVTEGKLHNSSFRLNDSNRSVAVKEPQL